MLNNGKLPYRQKQAKATHELIRKTAIKLFYKDGFDKVTVEQICRQAGLSKGSFYVYYPSKEHVILELFAKQDEMMAGYLSNDLSTIEDPVEKMWLLGVKSLSYMKELGVEVVQVTYRGRLSFYKHSNTYRQENRAIYKILGTLIKEAQQKGYMRKDLSAEEISLMMVHCFNGVSHDWCVANDSFDLIAEGQKVFELMLKGLAPRQSEIAIPPHRE